MIIGNNSALFVPDEAGTCTLRNFVNIEVEQTALHGDGGDISHRGRGGFKNLNGVSLVRAEIASWYHRTRFSIAVKAAELRVQRVVGEINSGKSNQQHRNRTGRAEKAHGIVRGVLRTVVPFNCYHNQGKEDEDYEHDSREQYEAEN